MRIRGWLVASAFLAATAAGHDAAAQEVAIKGALAISRFDIEGATPFDDRLIATSFGGHYRFRLGPVSLQPEIHVVTRGATIGQAEEQESLRLEYLEIPLLLALPINVGNFEVVALGGPMVALETRCRFVFETEGLKTNVGCDPPRDPLFRRRAGDYGLVAGGGVSHRVGGGRVLVEARHTWGFRDIHDGATPTELRNRTLLFMIGYVVMWSPDGL
jgi:hypothetical protein